LRDFSTLERCGSFWDPRISPKQASAEDCGLLALAAKGTSATATKAVATERLREGQCMVELDYDIYNNHNLTIDQPGFSYLCVLLSKVCYLLIF
jgi:hypothetical protein